MNASKFYFDDRVNQEGEEGEEEQEEASSGPDCYHYFTDNFPASSHHDNGKETAKIKICWFEEFSRVASVERPEDMQTLTYLEDRGHANPLIFRGRVKAVVCGGNCCK